MKCVVSLFYVAVLALVFTINNVSAGDCEGTLLFLLLECDMSSSILRWNKFRLKLIYEWTAILDAFSHVITFPLPLKLVPVPVMFDFQFIRTLQIQFAF